MIHPTLCTNCAAQLIPAAKLATRLRKVNGALHAVGLKYWETITAAMNEVEMSLESNGFKLVEWSYATTTNTARVHAEVGDGKWLSLSIYRMESGNYEVTAYVN